MSPFSSHGGSDAGGTMKPGRPQGHIAMLRIRRVFSIVAIIGAAAVLRADFTPSGLLEIHYINVGQGGGTLIIGPDGTRLLYDFGNVGRGDAIVAYLRDTLHLDAEQGVHFTILSHRDQDHYGGFVDLIKAGYEVHTANFDSGSTKPATARMRSLWLGPALTTEAGAVLTVPVGLRIPLGDGAEARVIAANGKIHRRGRNGLPSARDENDRSISVYVKYKDFDFLLDGDLGAGPEASACSDHQTGQANFQGPVAQALIDLGWMSAARGVDILHIAHHGSESSTSSAYYNLTKPEVGLISVGLNQGTFRHPREDVTTKVLLGPGRPACVTAPPLVALFQTESGKAGSSTTGSTSFRGLPIGDIRVMTDGMSDYQVSGTGRVRDGVACANPAAGFWRFALDEQTATPFEQVNRKCKVSTTSCECKP
jgi:beta-lactamase superfamily II metal-dependent hydrolase